MIGLPLSSLVYTLALTNIGLASTWPVFDVSLAPHQQQEVTLQIPVFKSPEGSEFYVNVYALTKNATELIPAGHEVAREQFKFAGDYFARSVPTAASLK